MEREGEGPREGGLRTYVEAVPSVRAKVEDEGVWGIGRYIHEAIRAFSERTGKPNQDDGPLVRNIAPEPMRFEID